MSLKIIAKLLQFIQDKLHIGEDDITIKTIEIEHDCAYTIEMQIHGSLYSIRHYEPLPMKPHTHYGTGHWYNVSLFNPDKNHYETI